MRYKCLLLGSCLPLSLFAATDTYTWIPTASSTAWSTGTAWTHTGTSANAFPNGSTATAVFSPSSGASTISANLDLPVTINGITFSSSTSPYHITNQSNSDNLTFQANGGVFPNITSNGLSNAIYCPIILADSLNISFSASGGTVSLGPISEINTVNNVNIQGGTSGVVILLENGTYMGSTNVSGGLTLQAGGAGVFSSVSSVFSVAGDLDLNNYANTINSLTGNGTVTSSGVNGTLTLLNGGSFAGTLQNGLGMTISGGTFYMSGTSSYDGNTVINNDAVFVLNSGSALAASSPIIVNDSAQLLVNSSSSGYSLTGAPGAILTVASGQTFSVSIGGNFKGTISGPGNFSVIGGGILTLTNNNTIQGTISVGTGAELALSGAGEFSSVPPFVVGGVLDISGISSATTIGTLSGSAGTINLGSKTLTVTQGSDATFAGVLQGVGGSFIKQGGSTLTLGLTSTNSGTTTVAAGTLAAASTSAFSSLSPFVVNGTLSLVSFNNTIYSLSGTGTVNLGTATLTIGNGGTFGGTISGAGGIVLSSGIFSLNNAATYTGSTTVNGGTFALVGSGSIASGTGAVTVEGVLDISQITGTSATLNGGLGGSGRVALGNNTLILGSSGTFSGTLSDGGAGGGLTVGPSVSVTLNGVGSYSGTTTINSSATLTAGSTTALSPNSNFVMNGSSTLSLGASGFSNTIASLSGTGTVSLGSSGVLTITNGSNGGSFGGAISGGGGLNLTGGTFFLSGSGSNYSGSTVLSNNAVFRAGASGAFSSGSLVTINDSATLDLQTFSNTVGGLSGGVNSIVNVGTGATLTYNGGGVFQGVMEGMGNLTLTGGTSIFSNNNTIQGTITVTSGAALALVDGGEFSSTPSVIMGGGIFDITGIISSTNIGSLSGSAGTMKLGAKSLTVIQGTDGTFSGTVQGPGGNFTKLGGSTLTLAGTATNSGTTTVAVGTLAAGSTSAFSSLSPFVVNGTLSLASFNNTIYSLSGTGTVNLGTATLTIAQGGNFLGSMTGTGGGFTAAGGTLLLGGNNTHGGAGTIQTGALVRAESTGAFSPNAPFIVSGTLDLNNFNNTIYSLSGSGLVTTGLGAGGTLTLISESIFAGGITGNGGLTLSSGTSGYYSVTLNTQTGANTYSGTTSIGAEAILYAGGTNALSPYSEVVLSSTGGLSINGYNNIIKGLSSASSSSFVSLEGAILTINGGLTTTFSGSLTNNPPGGITLEGGTILTLNGTSNTYSGPTVISDGELIITGTGALSPNTAITVASLGTLDITPSSSAKSLTNSGTSVIHPGPLALSDFYTQTSAGSLTLGFTSSAEPILTAVNTISLDGSLIVSGTGAPTGEYPLLYTSSGTIPTGFSTFSTTGFDSGVSPFLAYAPDTVYLYFSSCNSDWNSNGSTTLKQAWSNAANWNAACVPGVNGNVNDTANFPDFSGAPSTVTVKVANEFGTGPAALILGNLNLSATNTSYTITGYNSSSSITFDLSGDGAASINVTGGNHSVNVPLILDVDTRLNLADGVSLTFTSATTMTSPATQDFSVRSSGTNDTGEMVNRAELTPYSFTLDSGKVSNEEQILPTNLLVISPSSGYTATFTNAASGAVAGPTARNAVFTVGGTGSVVMNNTARGAGIGPSGAGGSMTFEGSGSIVVTNSGVGATVGPTGTGGGLTVTTGTFTNEGGAVLTAGPSGVLTISGGSIVNDVSSKIGSLSADLIFSGGTIDTAGDISAYNYTQNGSSVLQLDLTSLQGGALILGNVSAEGTAEVGSSLIVNALPGSISTGSDATVDLVYAEKGVSGTYSSVTYQNFPQGVIPNLVYTPNAVQLTTSGIVPSTPAGSFTQIGFLSINQSNILIQREIHDLHERIMDQKTEERMAAVSSVSENIFLADAGSDLQREQHYLTERTGEASRPSRFYFGPTGQFGKFNGQSSVQRAFDFTTVGIFTGFDHAFSTFGLGVNLEYDRWKARQHDNSGKFEVDEVLGSLYATWSPEKTNALAVDAIAGWGGQWFDMHRITGPSVKTVTANGTSRSLEADALLGVEYIFSRREFSSMPSNVLFTPFVNAQYAWVGINGYKENGAGIYNLRVQKQSAESLRSCIGTRFEYLVEGKNVSFKPELDLAWQREYLDHTRNLTFSPINFSGAGSLTKEVFGAGRNTFLVGTDFLITVYKTFEIEISYDFAWNDLYTDNSFYLGLGGRF